MIFGHFRAFLSLAYGILQVGNGFEIYPLSNNYFNVFFLSLLPLAKVKRREQMLVHCCSHFFLPHKSNSGLFCFQPRAQRVCRAKTHIKVRTKGQPSKIILCTSGNCLRACFFTRQWHLHHFSGR